MHCTCIAEIESSVSTKYNGGRRRVECKLTGKVIVKDLGSFFVTYSVIVRVAGCGKEQGVAFVLHKYCPFCGRINAAAGDININ